MSIENYTMGPCPECGHYEMGLHEREPLPSERRAKRLVYVACGHCGRSALPAEDEATAVQAWNYRKMLTGTHDDAEVPGER